MDKENKNSINISSDVIATIVTTASKEVEGVCGIASGIESNVKKIFQKKNIITGVESHVDEEKNTIDIDASITVEFGYELRPVGLKVQEKIKDAIETMTNYKVGKINIKVANVKEVSKEIVQ